MRKLAKFSEIDCSGLHCLKCKWVHDMDGKYCVHPWWDPKKLKISTVGPQRRNECINSEIDKPEMPA